MKAGDEQCLCSLKDSLVGCVKVISLEMLEHLWSQCVMETLDVDQMEEELNTECEAVIISANTF